VVRRLPELRYRLIPYIYSEARHLAARGRPMIQHLVLEFPDDPNVYAIEDQYLFGRDLVAASDLTEEDERRIYIPEGGWYDFCTGERLRGPSGYGTPAPSSACPCSRGRGLCCPWGR